MANGILEGGQAIAQAINEIAAQRRAAQQRFAQVLIQEGSKDPTILQDPNAQKALSSYVGKENVGPLTKLLSTKSDPNAVIQQTLGITEGALRPAAEAGARAQVGAPQVGPLAPEQSAQVESAIPGQKFPILAEEAQRRGFGVSVSPTGTTVSRSAPSAKELGEAASLARFTAISDSLVQSGLPQHQADQLSARYTMGEMAKLGLVPPPDMRRMATAGSEAEIAGAKEGIVTRARIAAETEGAAGLASERARGSALGEARGAAEVAFDTVRVTTPTGEVKEIKTNQAAAFAATGNELARNLGKNPPKQQLEAAAMQGNDIFTAPDGSLIAVPAGSSYKLETVPAEGLLQGSEAQNALKEVRGIIENIEANPAFRESLPSEKQLGRLVARGVGWLQSWVRGVTDPATVLTQRGQLRQTGFRMARILGSNSQLSDAERINAQAVLQPLIDGTSTQEYYDAALSVMARYIDGADKRGKTKEKAVDGVDAFLGDDGTKLLKEAGITPSKGAKSKGKPVEKMSKTERQQASGATLRNMATNLAEEVNAGRITEEQARKRLDKARAAGLPEE